MARSRDAKTEEVKASVGSLSVSSFAERRDFRTIAALVVERGPNATSAFSALVAHAHFGEALLWAIACADADATLWVLGRDWPAVVRPAGEALCLLTREFTAAGSEGQTDRAVSLSQILPRVTPMTVRRELARLVLTVQDAEDNLLHQAAREVLAESRFAEDKDALLVDARRAPVGARLERIDGIRNFRSEDLSAAREALAELAQIPVTLAVAENEAAQRLAAAQDDAWLKGWLLESWTYEPARQSLINPNLGDLLGAHRLSSLITVDTSAALALQLAAAASQFDDEDTAIVVSAAYRAGHVATAAMRSLSDREPHSEAVWTVAVACADDSVATELGAKAQAGDLQAAADRIKDEPRAATLIAVAADAWSLQGATGDVFGRRVPPAAWDTEMQAVFAILGGQLLVELALRLGNEFAYPPGVLDLVLNNAEAIDAFCDAQISDQLADHAAAGSVPTQAVALLTRRPDDVRVDQPRLLEAVGWDDAGLWSRAVAVCDLAAVGQQIGRQFESLSLPLADRVPTEVVRATLGAAVDKGLAYGLQGSTVKVASALIAHDDDETVTLTCRWVTGLPVTQTEHEFVRAVIHADDQRDHGHQDLVKLRQHLADALCANALDKDLDDPTRIAHLNLAAVADPTKARIVALTITAPESDDLRLAAAQTLIDTSGQPSEEDTIDALYAKAKKAPLRQALSEARIALTAPDTATALASLAANLGAPITKSEVADARLNRYPSQEKTLLQLVNDVRASSHPGIPAKDYVNNAITLCDHMVDLAILATTDAGKDPYKSGVEKIRDGSRGRPDAGVLVNAQSVLNTLPWVAHVASLRRSRAAHPSRPNSTAPVVTTEQDRDNARYILGKVIRDWLDCMIDNY